MKRTAVFVDARYVWAQMAALVGGQSAAHGQVDPLEVNYPRLHTHLLQEAQAQRPDGELLRVYWYDAPGPGGKTAAHHAIDQLDDFKLRLGACPGPGQHVGLAGLMTADLMGLAQHRAITHALVVSDDAGLVPGVLAVQSMGLRVHGLSLGATPAAGTALAAEWDRKCHWGLGELQSLLADGWATDTSAPKALAPPLLAWAPGAGLGHAISPFSPLPSLGSLASRPLLQREVTANLSLTGVAQLAHDHLQAGPNTVVFAALKPGMSALPREIDGALLAVGRKALGRALTEPEKRELRREFQAVVQRSFEDRLHKTPG
jgi:hypothetical protein